jgi:hypothetical protein
VASQHLLSALLLLLLLLLLVQATLYLLVVPTHCMLSASLRIAAASSLLRKLGM